MKYSSDIKSDLEVVLYLDEYDDYINAVCEKILNLFGGD